MYILRILKMNQTPKNSQNLKSLRYFRVNFRTKVNIEFSEGDF